MGKKSALFNIGDIVRLKSGGPPMTVVELPPVDLPSLPTMPLRCYSRPLRMAAITRGLRRPWMTATTHKGLFSGAYAIR